MGELLIMLAAAAMAVLALMPQLSPHHTATLCSLCHHPHPTIHALHMREGSNSGAGQRKQMARARRSQAQQGLGGFTKRSGAKRSERKAPASTKGFGKQGALNFNRRPSSPTAACACGSNIPYFECCASVHEGTPAPNPEALVRARYSAYVYRLPEFLMETTDPHGAEWNSDSRLWKKSLLAFCDDFEFQGLEVGEAQQVSDNEASVHFRAKVCQKGTLNLLVACETSSFSRDATSSTWLYADGQVTYEAQEVEMTDEDHVRLAAMKEKQNAGK